MNLPPPLQYPKCNNLICNRTVIVLLLVFPPLAFISFDLISPICLASEDFAISVILY